MLLNSLPNDTILDWSKLKAFADDNIIVIVIQNLRFASGRVKNIVGKGENAGYQHFLLFRQCFQKASFSGSASNIVTKVNACKRKQILFSLCFCMYLLRWILNTSFYEVNAVKTFNLMTSFFILFKFESM